MAEYRTLDDLDVTGKTVLVRADLNVPMKDGAVTDSTRIDAVVPTVKALLRKGATVVVMSHFGRPKGAVVPEMSLKPVASALDAALGAAVIFAPDCVGADARDAIHRAGPGQVVLLENLRFHAGEESNDERFARELAALGDAYVNDAFSSAHRAHASTEGIAHHLPSAAGEAMIAEIRALEKALESPRRPVAAIVGGAKISTKLDVLGHLVGKVDHLIVGGAMANTFLYAEDVNVGKSLIEAELAETAREIMGRAAAGSCRIHLPKDAAVAAELKAGAASRVAEIRDVGDGDMILDVGPATVKTLKAVIAGCHTVLWNGPLGAFEVPPFDAGTNALAEYAGDLTAAGEIESIAGGGDTVAALRHAGVIDRFTHVSTAGGAFLEWLEGKSLPGVKVLEKANG